MKGKDPESLLGRSREWPLGAVFGQNPYHFVTGKNDLPDALRADAQRMAPEWMAKHQQ